MLILACCWWLGSVSGALAQKRPFVFRMAAVNDRESEQVLGGQFIISFGLDFIDDSLPLTIRYQKEGASEWQEKTLSPSERLKDHYYLFPVPSAGNYIVEIPVENIYSFESWDGIHLTILSWGDIVWRDCRILSRGKANIQEAIGAGMPNLSQVKRLKVYSSFNIPIRHWDVSHVENIEITRYIDQNLGEWKLRQCKELSFRADAFSTANYSASLIGWAAQDEIATGVVLDARNMTYNSTAVAAREKLIKEKGWRISGDFLSEEEYILRFAEPKYMAWVGARPKVKLLVHGISRQAIQIINVSNGKVIDYYDYESHDLDAWNIPGTYKIIARVPEVKGVHKALQTECEVVVKNRIPISVKIDGKEKYTLGINKEHTLKIECEDPDIRFTYRPNEWFEKNVVIKETAKNTWTFQLKRLATSEGVGLDSLFQSTEANLLYHNLHLPYLKWGKEYSRSFDLALYGTPTEVALLLENASADTKLEFGVAQGKEVIEVTPEGIVKAKAVGNAQIYAMLQGQESTKQFFNVRVWGMPKIIGKGVRTEGGKTIVAMVVGDTHSSFRLEEEYEEYFSYEWKYPPHVHAGQALSAEANGEKIEVELKRDNVHIKTSITVEVVPAKLPLERFELLIDGKVVKEGDTFSLSYLDVRNKDLIVRYYPYNTDDGKLVSQQLKIRENYGSFLIKKPGKYPVHVQSLTHPDKVLNFFLEITVPELKSIGLKYDDKEVTGDVLEIPFSRYGDPLYIYPEPRGAYGDWEVVQESGEECLGISLDMSYHPNIRLDHKKEGSSTIVIRTKDKKFSRRLTIKLIPETLAVELQKGEKKIYKMRYFSDTPTITITPEGIVKATLHHRESLELEALGEVGQKATVTLQYKKGRLVYEVSIKDAARQLRGIAFNPWYLGLRPGESAPLSLSFDPPTADVKEVTFEYSDDGNEYLRYENGILHIAADIPLAWVHYSYTIVAKSPFGFETKFRVEVLPPELFEVKLLKEGEGRLSIEGHHDQMLNTIPKGTELTVKAEASEGYTLTALMAGGKDILATKKFTVTSAIEVKAVFVKKANSDDNQDNNKPPLALEDATLATIAVSPNPFSSQLRIINSEGIQGRYEFVSSTGVLLRSGALEGKEIVLETSELPAGIYLVRVYGANAMQKSVRVLKY